MYTLEWVERLKNASLSWPGRRQLSGVNPVVWSLGLTSLLTDISSEMVSSILPGYLVLHLRLSPLEFAAIDGVYNGLSVALVAVLAGVLSDGAGRHKVVALTGYAISAACKLGLLFAGGAWGLITGIVALDRLGKGIRTAPRDSMISLHTDTRLLGTAFGVHRALDATGALLGPLIAFVLLAQIPGAFDVLWVISFIAAFLGVAALWLFVPSRSAAVSAIGRGFQGMQRFLALKSRRFVSLCGCGTILALLTISDGFIYLILQQKSEANPVFVPLFYVGTAIAYMLFAIPAGLLADRFGRTTVFAGGYGLLVALYVVVLVADSISLVLVFACLTLLGVYYAASEGVLMALASSIAPHGARATGLAMLATSIGLGKLVASLAFGLAWQLYGPQTAVAIFAGGAALALLAIAPRLRSLERV